MDEERFGLYKYQEQFKSFEQGRDTIRTCCRAFAKPLHEAGWFRGSRLEAEDKLGKMCRSLRWTTSPGREASLCEWKVGQRVGRYCGT